MSKGVTNGAYPALEAALAVPGVASALAKRLGVSRVTLWRWRTGRWSLTTVQIEQICRELPGLEPADFYPGVYE